MDTRDIAAKAAQEVTQRAYCQYGNHMAPLDRMTTWKPQKGPAKRICITCQQRRKK